MRHVPVIVLTSSTDAETKLKALELGATDFLAKPTDPSELALRLRNTLSAKAYRDRLANYDSVTALPNRRLLVDRLERALRETARAGNHRRASCTCTSSGSSRSPRRSGSASATRC